MFAPPLHFDNIDSTYAGGFFLDRRANTLEEQAQKPFLNPLEMNNSNVQMLISKIENANYYSLYKRIYGEATDHRTTFNNIAEAIASFERTPDLNPFTFLLPKYL